MGRTGPRERHGKAQNGVGLEPHARAVAQAAAKRFQGLAASLVIYKGLPPATVAAVLRQVADAVGSGEAVAPETARRAPPPEVDD